MDASPLIGRWYLVALTTLLINDFWLKRLYPGAITGKLSDFAGVFAIAVFFAALMPRRAESICIAVGTLFVLWKLPQTTPLIDAWNRLDIFPVGRVADLTDIVALLVLPFVPSYVRRPPSPQRAAAIPVACLSLFAFAATSPARVMLSVPPDDPLAAMQFRMSLSEFTARLERCGMEPSASERSISIWYDSRVGGLKREARAAAEVKQIDDSIQVSVSHITVLRQIGPVDEQPFRDELLQKIRGCVADHFSFAIGPTFAPVTRR